MSPPSTSNASASNASASNPAASTPTVSPPSTSNASASNPAASNPATSHPSTSHPSTSNPTASHPRKRPAGKGPEVAPDDDAHRLTSLPQAARAFFRRPGPRLMAATVVASWARRAMAGGFTWREVPAAALTAAWWPFQEWLAHDKLLHLEPFEVAGRRFDLFAAREHRAHHRQPRGIDKTLLPFSVVAAGIPIGRALAHLTIRDRKVRGTVMATYVTCSLAYEWTHFIVHTGVKPKSAFYARIRRNHLFHHHLNENYWFGFTWPDVDRWMGTEPDPKTVPRSPTARDLHGLAEEDLRRA